MTARKPEPAEGTAEAPVDVATIPAIVPVHIAVARVMGDVQKIAKDDQTAATGKYMYRGIDRVQNEVGPALRRHGVLCIPRVLDYHYRDTESSGGKVQHEAILEVEFTFYGPEGDKIVGSAMGESTDTSDKATAQAHSVALRTFLLQGLCIPSGDPDPDEHEVTRGNQRAKAKVATDEAAKALGWPNGADQARVWAECLDEQKAVPAGDALKAIIAWGKAEGLGPMSLTPQQAAQWHGMLLEAMQTDAADEAIDGSDDLDRPF